ncbi:MAG TPA: ABC transporter substrate-binding protein [Rhodospirillaceae bacterium]|nr:ABC transporter substrate-binding protein [Candidatus Neomarinimicrobiota bacterium]HCX13867.1 ABC transporter substrate-binding protein [Rhodospirillaceae bacterium]
MRFLVLIFVLILPSVASACEVSRPIVFAGLDWESAAFHNAVARFILENGYECKTDAIPGSTIPMMQGVAQGDIDVAMEVWKDNVTNVWQRALEHGKVKELGVNFPDAEQGWYVPRYLVEGDLERNIKPLAPGLKSVTDLPTYKDVFSDPEEKGKGRFYNCVAGWNCEVINSAKLKAYGLSDYYTNFRPGTGAALAAAIGGAYLRGEPILAYYWTPTWVLGKYDLIQLNEPPWNQTDWDGLSADPEYPRAVAYPVVSVWIGVNTKFANNAPDLIKFLTAYATSAALVNEALSYMREHNVEAEDAARHFLSMYPKVWKSWVDETIATRVQAAIPP